jgi:hypothetical protein
MIHKYLVNPPYWSVKFELTDWERTRERGETREKYPSIIS